MEEWKQTEFISYDVSNLGRVRSMFGGNERILKPQSNGRGYFHVEIRGKTQVIHRLVALAFCEGKTEEKFMVNHKDRNKTNNKAENLEWCSNSENQLNRIVRGCICFENRKMKRKLKDGTLREHIYPRFRVSYSIANRKVISKTFKTEQEAKDCLEELQKTYPR
jgi:hypothetical protein